MFALYAALARAGDFTVVVVPDTQYYACTGGGSCAGDLGIYEDQFAWIAANRDALDIRYVASVGDVVHHADEPDEFDVADVAFGMLEAAVSATHPDGVPYGIAVGNHDQDPPSNPGTIPTVLDVLHPGQGSTTTLFDATFGVHRFCPSGVCRSYYGGHFGTNNNNSYALFEVGDYAFVVVHVEYMPADTALRRAVYAWADQVLTRHADRRAIVVSHEVVDTGNPAPLTPQGAALYAALRHHPNLALILAGHIPGEGRRTDVFDGNTVHTLMADYQGRVDGGQGWLRLLQFQPDLDRISVQTYSPWLDAYETDASSQFTVPYDLAGGFPDRRASFSAATDTRIEAGTGSHGTEPTSTWGTSPQAAALIRFGSLFDTEGGPIPAGSEITSALLIYAVHDPGHDATLHPLTAPWTDTVTHATLGPTAGAQPGEDYAAAPVATAPGAAGVHAVDVTASVAAWTLAPSTHHGWVFVPTGADAVSVASSEHPTLQDRPRLAVFYVEPGTVRPRTVTLTDIDAAYVSAASPSTRFVGTLEVDTAGVFEHAFVKPAHLTGLAPGDQILRAELVLPIVDGGNDVQVRPVLAPWQVPTLSYTAAPATGPASTTFPGRPAGEVAVDVTSLVQGWVDGAPAHGVNLYPTGSDGVDIGAGVRLVVRVAGAPPCTDADGDGHCGGDCDDADPATHPGAPEVCGDGLDNDCDGVVDCPSGPRTVLLADIDDAHVSGAARSTNLGAAPVLEVDTAGTFLHAFVKPVDLGDIAPGALVTRAQLLLHVADPGSPVEVREVLGPWAEGTVTWNTAPPAGPPLTTITASTGATSVDVTALVQRWVDGAPAHGVNLYPTASNGVDLASAEHADLGLRPRFVVDIVEPPATCADLDGDAHPDSACGGRDCDDVDPAVHPGALEVCGDGVDQDCTGGDCAPVPRSILLTDLADAYVADASPAANFGASPTLEVDTAGTFKQAFLAPGDLGVVPGAEVLRAELVLRVSDAGSAVEVREVLGAWDEAAVTWASAPPVGPPLATFSAAVGQVAVDVTDLVQGWVDGAPAHGLCLYPTGSNGVDFHSADHADPGLRPALLIEVREGS